MRRSRGRKRLIVVMALVGLVAIATYAYTATNTFASTTNKAGDGAQAISGYVVSNVEYTLNSTDPTRVSAVDFDLDAPATTVKAKLTAAGLTYVDCIEDAVTANHWSCPTGLLAINQPTLTSIDNLRVLAVQ